MNLEYTEDKKCKLRTKHFTVKYDVIKSKLK